LTIYETFSPNQRLKSDVQTASLFCTPLSRTLQRASKALRGWLRDNQMEHIGLQVTAVAIGAVVLGAVVWRYVRFTDQKNTTLSVTLGLIGFILVSSPLWASIVVKGPQWEVSLLREQSTKQAEQYLGLLEAYQKALPEPQAQEVSPAVSRLRSSLEELKEVRDNEEKLKKIQEIAKQTAEITVRFGNIAVSF